MLRTTKQRAFHHLITLVMTVGVGSGCLAIYSFDAQPPATCRQKSDCPGTDACGQRVCEQGVCRVDKPVVPGGVPIEEPRGDCLRRTCDGEGNEVVAVDDSDVPFDGNACTIDICAEGTPSNVMAAAGTPCGQTATVQCNDAGLCVGCTNADDCGIDTACVHWTCDEGICLRVLSPIGTVASDAVPGDCRQNLCNETGESPETFSPSDAPSDDNPCTVDVCLPHGEVTHDNAPEGTKCGDCSACSAGICGPCDSAVADCFNGECIPKPQACTSGSDCASTYCVDGYCCNGECSGQCMACSQTKTGLPSGLCGPVTNGNDPDQECANADSCWNGVCQCQNGQRDGAEFGVDCGGLCPACSGTWNCGGANPCAGNQTPDCCAFLCLACLNETQACQSIHGQSCLLGAPPIEFSLGVTSYPGCQNSLACDRVRCECQ